MYIQSYLQSKGKDCTFIDARFEGIPVSRLLKIIPEMHPRIIGFSAMTHQIDYVSETATELKKAMKDDVLFVIGGPHTTAVPQQTLLQYPVFDVAVFGEGEYTFDELAESLDNERPLDEIKGIAWRDGSEIKINEPREPIMDLDKLPFPAWNTTQKIQVYPVLSARGCPFQCAFCMRVLGNHVRKRSIENVIEEIEWLSRKFGASYINFIDETFTVDRERILKLTDMMIKGSLNKKIKWHVGTRVNLVDREILQKMKDAGCTGIEYGIESGNQGILDNIRKGITLEQAAHAVKMTRELGLGTATFFILGHPFETEETIKDTVDFATSLNADFVAFGIMVPYPGTQIHEMACKGEGNYRTLSSDWRDFNKTVGNSLELTNITRKELEKKQLSAYLHFYIYNHRFLDLFKTFLRNWRIVLFYIKKWD